MKSPLEKKNANLIWQSENRTFPRCDAVNWLLDWQTTISKLPSFPPQKQQHLQRQMSAYGEVLLCLNGRGRMKPVCWCRLLIS